MLYRIIISSVLFFTLSALNGQITIQGGANASSLRRSNGVLASETSSRLGFHLGVHYSSPIGTNFKFSPGVLYSQKGAGFGSFVPTRDLNYLDIPLLFMYQKYPEQSFYAEGGPYLAYLLSAKEGRIELKKDYKSLHVGILLGAGYDLGNIVIGGRGLIGFTNIPTQDQGTRQNIRTSTITGQLYIGYQL